MNDIRENQVVRALMFNAWENVDTLYAHAHAQYYETGKGAGPEGIRANFCI